VKLHQRRGEAVVGGYTWHTAVGSWAVFEDILTEHKAVGR
jgi:hypothetical protein